VKIHCDHIKFICFQECPVSNNGLLLPKLPSIEKSINTFPAQQESTTPKGKDKAPEASDDDMIDAPDSPPHDSGTWQTSGPQGPLRDFTTNQPLSPPSNAGSRANGETKIHFGAPGSSWNTKKFSEEYERTDLNLVDRQWNSMFNASVCLKPC